MKTRAQKKTSLTGKTQTPTKDTTPQRKMEPVLKSKLTKTDVICPICMCIYINPVTFPCGHSVCHKCFCGMIRNTLNCPCCRVRLSVWSRRAIKENTLVNHAFKKQLEKQFTEAVASRLEELAKEEEENEEDDDEDCSQNSLFIRTGGGKENDGDDEDDDGPDIYADESVSGVELGRNSFSDIQVADQIQVPERIISAPGEIAEEYKTLLRQHQAELERERQAQIAASLTLIDQLREKKEVITHFTTGKKIVALPSPPVLRDRSKVKKEESRILTSASQSQLSNIGPNRKRNYTESFTNSKSSRATLFRQSQNINRSSPNPYKSVPKTKTLSSIELVSMGTPSTVINTSSHSSASSSSTSSTLSRTTPQSRREVVAQEEQEALERFRQLREQEEKDRKLALRLQSKLQKMKYDSPTKPTTRSDSKGRRRN